MIVLDDRIFLHPLIFPLSDRAIVGLLRIFGYVSQWETEWVVATRFVPNAVARELTQNGLIEHDGGVYRVNEEARELAQIGPSAARIGHVSKALDLEVSSEDLATKEQVSKALEAEYFARFWNGFGLKTGRKKAEEAFHKAIRHTDPEAIIEGARAYREWLDSHPSPPQQKYAQGWLNGERWNDELPPYPTGNGLVVRKRDDFAGRAIRAAAERGDFDRG